MKRRQQLSFCTSTDGTRIAVASLGSGPVLLRAAHWLSHVEYDLDSPVWQPWVEALSQSHRYVRYDLRGCGLSDRQVSNISLANWIDDLDAVAATIAEPQFALFGMSQGGALAINFALRHPERVSHLVLCGAYGRGASVRAENDAQRLVGETLLNLIKIGWGRDQPAFRQVFTNLFLPDGTPEQHQWWAELESRSASVDVAARTFAVLQTIDVLEAAKALQVPTLVLHSRGDARVPFDEGRRLAAAIPAARFVPLDSRNHVLLPTEPAWAVFHAEVTAFLGSGQQQAMDKSQDGLTAAETAVLTLLAQGLDNRTIAERLGKHEKTVRNQVSTIMSKMGVHSRAEAIVRALKH